MASYISDYTGKQIDEVIKLFDGKGLINIEGIIKKNSDGTYSAADWSNIPNTPTTLSGYGITDAHITNGVVTLGKNTIEPVPTSMVETVTTDSDSKISTSKAMKTYVDTYGGKIDTISINGMEKPAVNKNVDIIIPTKVSHLTNDSDFRTGAQVSTAIQTALANGTNPYQTKSNVDTAISAAVSSAYKYKGSVATQQDLPSSGNVVGDVYDVQDNGMNYAWNGTAWDALGQYVDLSVLATKSEVTTGLAGKQDTLVSSTNIKTINSQSILGSGDLVIDESVEDVTVDGTSVVTNKIAQIDLSGKQDKLIGTHTAGQNIKTVNGISLLGSGDVDLYCYVFSNDTSFTKLAEAYYYSAAFYCVDDNYNTHVPSVYAIKDSDSHVTSLKFQYQDGETLHSWTVDNSDTWTIEATTNLQSKLIGTQTTGQNIKTINGDSLLGSGNLIIGGNVDDVTVDGTSVVTNKIAAISLNGKQDILVSGTNIKTINNQSILGSGNIEIGGGGTSVQSDWTETDTSSAAYILNKPILSTVATSGDYSDLTNKPTLSAVATSGNYNDLTNKPTLSIVATSGDYTDLTNKPTLSSVATSGDYDDLTNKPTLSTVATSGAYSDLSGKPTFSTVATSGSYNDLTDKPTIPPQLIAGTGITIDSNNVISVNLVSAETQSF